MTITIEMSENLRKWVEALRSGNWNQANGRLVDINGSFESYCCLGVGCELAGIPRIHEEFVVHGIHYDTMPPQEFREWLGLETHGADGDVNIDWPADLPWHACDTSGYYSCGTAGGECYSGMPPTRVAAAYMNDELGFSFAQIADMITYFGVR